MAGVESYPSPMEDAEVPLEHLHEHYAGQGGDAWTNGAMMSKIQASNRRLFFQATSILVWLAH